MGTTPVTYQVKPGALKVVVPTSTEADAGPAMDIADDDEDTDARLDLLWRVITVAALLAGLVLVGWRLWPRRRRSRRWRR